MKTYPPFKRPVEGACRLNACSLAFAELYSPPLAFMLTVFLLGREEGETHALSGGSARIEQDNEKTAVLATDTAASKASLALARYRPVLYQRQPWCETSS